MRVRGAVVRHSRAQRYAGATEGWQYEGVQGDMRRCYGAQAGKKAGEAAVTSNFLPVSPLTLLMRTQQVM